MTLYYIIIFCITVQSNNPRSLQARCRRSGLPPQPVPLRPPVRGYVILHYDGATYAALCYVIWCHDFKSYYSSEKVCVYIYIYIYRILHIYIYMYMYMI